MAMHIALSMAGLTAAAFAAAAGVRSAHLIALQAPDVLLFAGLSCAAGVVAAVLVSAAGIVHELRQQRMDALLRDMDTRRKERWE